MRKEPKPPKRVAPRDKEFNRPLSVEERGEALAKRAEAAATYTDPLPFRSPIAGTLGTDALSVAMQGEGEAGVTIRVGGWFERAGVRYLVKPQSVSVRVKAIEQMGE